MIKIEYKSSPFLFFTIIGLLVITSLARLLPHPWNFSPLGALAIFGGATIANRFLNVVLPLFFVWISDILVNNVLYKNYFNEFVWFYDGFYWQYFSYALISFLAYYVINSFKFVKILFFTIASSLLFYLISNFGVWASGTLYPKNVSGLITCYIAGLPFLKGNLYGDLIYTSLLFGVFYLVAKKYYIKYSV